MGARMSQAVEFALPAAKRQRRENGTVESKRNLQRGSRLFYLLIPALVIQKSAYHRDRLTDQARIRFCLQLMPRSPAGKVSKLPQSIQELPWTDQASACLHRRPSRPVRGGCPLPSSHQDARKRTMYLVVSKKPALSSQLDRVTHIWK